jgi:hypothetical protein
MWRVVILDMIGMAIVSASTALSPEWDRWFDEEFTDLVTADDDLVRGEFDALIAGSWRTPPPAPPAPPTASPAPDDEGGAEPTCLRR